MSERRIPYSERGALTVEEAAEYCGVSLTTAKRHIASGAWPVLRIGDRRINRRMLDAWIDAQTENVIMPHSEIHEISGVTYPRTRQDRSGR